MKVPNENVEFQERLDVGVEMKYKKMERIGRK